MLDKHLIYVVAEEREAKEEREGHAVENDEYAWIEFAEEEYDEMVNFMFHRNFTSIQR